jgi:hypothetical protein
MALRTTPFDRTSSARLLIAHSASIIAPVPPTHHNVRFIMTRPNSTLGLAVVLGLGVALALACDSHPTTPRQPGVRTSDARSASVAATSVTALSKIVSFETMYGVDEAFVKHTQIRGVRGDELPWDVGSAVGSLTVGGHLTVSVRGIVFANDPEVPVNLRGINDEEQFRALVSCLVSDHKGNVATVNVTTQGFAATPTGNSDIDAMVTLPSSCVAPIIFILSGSEDKWFAVMGAETP